MAYGDSTLGTMEYELSGMLQKRRVLKEKKSLRPNEHNQLDILNSNIENLKEKVAQAKRRLRK